MNTTCSLTPPTFVNICSDEKKPNIGHGKTSMTFIPELGGELKCGDSDPLMFCDTPGFMDNRGPEINIANAVNSKQTFISAKSVRILCLLNYDSLQADRCAGVNNMIEIITKLFGNENNFLKHQDSITMGIAKMPQKIRLENTRQFIMKGNKSKVMKALENKLFTLDPLETHPDCTKRGDLAASLSQLQPLEQDIGQHHAQASRIMQSSDICASRVGHLATP